MKLANWFALWSLVAVVGAQPVAATVWSPLPAMPEARWLGRAERIGDRIFVIGGSLVDAVATVSVLDLGTRTWSTAAPLPEARSVLCSGVIDGKIYVVAGDAPGPSPRASGWVYDPAANAWSTIAALPGPRTNAACAVVGGKLYVISGAPVNSDAPVSDVFVYDPTTDTWIAVAPIPTPRKLAIAAVVGDRIVVAGGHTAGYGVADMVRTVEVYDVSTNTWSTGPDLPVALTGAAAVSSLGRVWLLGGIGPAWGPARSDVVSLRLGEFAWHEEPGLPEGAFAPGAVVSPTGSLLVLGGSTGDAPLAAVHEWTFAPDLVSVRDVPNDQGGRVVLRWTASFLDRVPANPIEDYWVWREVPSAQARAMLRAGSHLLASRAEARERRAGTLRLGEDAGQTHYWEYVTTLPARGHAGYSYSAQTLCDSIAGSNPPTVFMVEAEAASGEFWSSGAVAGYSVDNLAPSTPASLAGTWSPTGMALRWRECPEPDVASYRVYAGDAADFEPSVATLVASISDTTCFDPTSAPHHYKVAGVDVHGNIGVPASWSPSGVAGAEVAAAPRVELLPASPNPANGSVRLRYVLARPGDVQMALHDVSGRRVRVLEQGIRSAGVHTSTVELTNSAGVPITAGIYYVRLCHAGQTRSTRLVVTR